MKGNEVSRGKRERKSELTAKRTIHSNHSIAGDSKYPKSWQSQLDKNAPSYLVLLFWQKNRVLTSSHKEQVDWLHHNRVFSADEKEWAAIDFLFHSSLKSLNKKLVKQNELLSKFKLINLPFPSCNAFHSIWGSLILHKRESTQVLSIRQPQTSIWGRLENQHYRACQDSIWIAAIQTSGNRDARNASINLNKGKYEFE